MEKLFFINENNGYLHFIFTYLKNNSLYVKFDIYNPLPAILKKYFFFCFVYTYCGRIIFYLQNHKNRAILFYVQQTYGDVAQLGEHQVRNLGVESSILFISTI